MFTRGPGRDRHFWAWLFSYSKKVVLCYLKFEKKKVMVIYFSNPFWICYSPKTDKKSSYLKTKQKLSYFQRKLVLLLQMKGEKV